MERYFPQKKEKQNWKHFDNSLYVNHLINCSSYDNDFICS